MQMVIYISYQCNYMIVWINNQLFIHSFKSLHKRNEVYVQNASSNLYLLPE